MPRSSSKTPPKSKLKTIFTNQELLKLILDGDQKNHIDPVTNFWRYLPVPQTHQTKMLQKVFVNSLNRAIADAKIETTLEFSATSEEEDEAHEFVWIQYRDSNLNKTHSDGKYDKKQIADYQKVYKDLIEKITPKPTAQTAATAAATKPSPTNKKKLDEKNNEDDQSPTKKLKKDEKSLATIASPPPSAAGPAILSSAANPAITARPAVKFAPSSTHQHHSFFASATRVELPESISAQEAENEREKYDMNSEAFSESKKHHIYRRWQAYERLNSDQDWYKSPDYLEWLYFNWLDMEDVVLPKPAPVSIPFKSVFEPLLATTTLLPPRPNFSFKVS